MCNYLKDIHNPIKEQGFGYKIFIKDKKTLLAPFRDIKYNRRGKWIKWDNSYDDCKSIFGFCFFTNKKTAKIILNSMIRRKTVWFSDLVIHKIEYRRGLGKQQEFYDERKYNHALCKEFKILEEVK